VNGTPGPDFSGEKGESEHVGRMTEEDIESAGGEEGLQAMGLANLQAQLESEKEIVGVANWIVALISFILRHK
jgi:Protein of unknown function (DUF1479)